MIITLPRELRNAVESTYPEVAPCNILGFYKYIEIVSNSKSSVKI